MEDTIIEEYFQSSCSNFERKKKQVPLNIAKLAKDISAVEKEYQEALESGNKFIIKEYEKILYEDKYRLKNYKEESLLLRAPSKEDIAYRTRQLEEFPNKIADSIPEEKKLCFHGTSIMGAKNIILTGGISSGADRFGHSTSYDPPGKISVTNKDTIHTSVKDYMRLVDDFCYPAGCIFVVTAKDQEEYNNLPSGWMIRNVDFRKNPERLVAIISTPENIERLTQWANEGGIDSSKVMDFDKFIRIQNNEKTKTQANILNTMKTKEITK